MGTGAILIPLPEADMIDCDGTADDEKMFRNLENIVF
jgi:hypothetical protein